MYLQRLLQINMATLAATGALLLGMGRRSPALPLLVLFAALVSIWLTDVTGWFRLDRRVGSLAALVAAAILLRGTYLHRELDVLAIANLLVCLQIILLFEEKDGRVYWLLAGLSLLQVVAATAFSQGVWFGLMLVVYMLLGLSALALLLLYRQWDRHRPVIQSSPPPKVGGRRWPLAAAEPTFAATPAGPPRAAIGREWFARLGQIGLATAVLTTLTFCALPRLGGTAWRGALPSPTRVVGFDNQVTLGELGEAIESHEEVMRVWFLDDKESPYPVTGEIYLHGTTLVDYAQGQWKPAEAPDYDLPSLGEVPQPPATGQVRQRCEIESLDRREIFSVMPLVAVTQNPGVLVDRVRGRLLRAKHLDQRRFSYRLHTTALAGGRQQPSVPNVQIASTDPLPQPPQPSRPQGLDRLVALADRWIAESGLPPEDRVGRARYLERMLARSGQFQYSLQGQARDPSIDPIEDFVSNNPRGHCEYFATALTLMLRSQQIPARVVVGYKCDEFNPLGEFYQVRQSHAHTWVEAYLRPEHLADFPPELLHGGDYWKWRSAGGWLRLDPTPAGGETETGGTFALLFDRAKRAVDRLESLWVNYVLEMDRQRQDEAIYQPLVRAVHGAIRKLRDPQWWRGLGEKIGWALDLTQGGAGYWLRLALLLPAGLLALLVAVRWLRRPLRRLWALLTGRAVPAAGRNHPKVEFYVRLEALLARYGLVRRAGQTQHEFAATAGTRIAAETGRPQLAPLPAHVVEAFYQVRFGRRPLDSPQTEAVEHALAELAACRISDLGFQISDLRSEGSPLPAPYARVPSPKTRNPKS